MEEVGLTRVVASEVVVEGLVRGVVGTVAVADRVRLAEVGKTLRAVC